MHNKMKSMISLLTTAVIMISFVACQPKEVNLNEIQPLEVETPVLETPIDQTIQVTDDLGRQITFNELPQRLVSGYYITSSMLLALGLKNSMVGIEAKADKRPLYFLAAPELLKVPHVGTAKEFNLEGALELKPDLLVVPIRLKDTVKTLEELEVKTLGVNPESWTDMDRVLRLLGKVTGTSQKAEEIITYNKSLLDKAKKIYSMSGRDEPTIYFGGNTSFLTTAGGKMHQSSLIKEAGAVNVAQELEDSYWSEVSYEQILAWQPEYIVLASDASYTVEDVLNDRALSGLTAVENKKIYKLPSSIESWDSPVPASVLGVMALTSFLHEEAYGSDEFKQDVVNYYEKFYGFSFRGELK